MNTNVIYDFHSADDSPRGECFIGDLRSGDMQGGGVRTCRAVAPRRSLFYRRHSFTMFGNRLIILQKFKYLHQVFSHLW